MSDSGVATKLRPWLFAFGIASVGVGLILLWTASAGWILVVTGSLELFVALLTPRIKGMDQRAVRLAVSVGFLILAAFLISNAANRDEGRTGIVVVALVGVGASVFVGALGIAKTYADRRGDADSGAPVS